MAKVTLGPWWKAREIPLVETDWRNIRIFCQQDLDPFYWTGCLYIVRLAPPFTIAYGDDLELESPLVYVGSGSIKQRWSTHRDWLYELGRAIPGGRYEVWVVQPKGRNNKDFYKDIEADVLTRFKKKTGYLPLRNKKIEGTPRQHTYPAPFFDDIQNPDRRYTWAMYPTRGTICDYYNAG